MDSKRDIGNVKMIYTRKKIRKLENDTVLCPSSKNGSFLSHVRGEKELMKAEGLPKPLSLSNEITMKNSQEQKLPNFDSFIMQGEVCSGDGEPWKDEGWTKELSFSNEIPRKVNFDFPSPSENEKHSLGMDTLDCSTIGLVQTYDLHVPLLDSSYCELRNISYMAEEDITFTAPYNTNSVISNMKAGFSNEDASLDVGHTANITKEHALQRSSAGEPDLRPLLDGVLDQPSVMNQSTGEDCNILSVELGFVTGISELHSHERLSMIEKDFEESLVERVWDDGTELLHHVDHNDQNASMLPCRNQLVIEAIDEINFHTKDGRLITGQLESNDIIVASTPLHCHREETVVVTFASGDDVKNSAAAEPASIAELTNFSEEKQRTLNDPHMKDHIASLGLQNLAGSNLASNNTSSTKEQDKNVEIGLMINQKVKDICIGNMHSKENRVDASTMASKNSSEQKLMPNFESFIILEEEGSGGYGTVYKGQRKEDGRVFAVKCPHANAHSHHVNNEMKMLERFGGRNFVIKYEGSFKNGDSECFVLEHVEHDRPEILKKEIGLFELQWYGFCMFRALASLHKQDVVHRDVKPGNFLFSRNVNKGYLIDFNLASDLQQKFCRSSKRKIPSASTYPNSLQESKSSLSFPAQKFIDRGLAENAKKEAANDFKRVQTSKSSKKKSQKDHDTFPIVDRSKHGSQTADVSGLTSTKDQTSNKTHADWLNQPMPSKGRKELINFVHKTMHNSQHLKPTSNGPSSQRKRIAAPMAPCETGLLILTPMPLHSGGNAVPGAGQKNKASGKAKREGPCVGTKGFRAPEVLFKSFHQGCKIDMWSAGVTMLYLMIGRAPFGGDPEHNIKEIARLRGSEELWEVAKLHNCESSFPVDLLDVGSLKSMGLREWCAKNTRRPDFLERIPESLLDLVDKCLTVNPRCRVSAEDALMHKFFAPCHESIRKQRLLRKVANSDPSSSNC
ncbi:Calcium-dependent protein kinase 22 [Platanthera guangdongensis]|uniref:non-specific serine/threonine protein kinase n=1 Tax=Platanthera guangdongensis TaxID=2320717 RepID=A0ABR2MJQ3_9ASPA